MALLECAMTTESAEAYRPLNSPPLSASSATSNESQTAKPGRPNKWTASRQRKLVRLYLYSTLPPKDIAKALREEEDKWEPG